jgi:hypothetical protein
MKVRDFAPKLLDKDDEESSYNQKYRLKVQKNKLRRIKSQTYRNLAQDAKVVQEEAKSRQDHVVGFSYSRTPLRRKNWVS